MSDRTREVLGLRASGMTQQAIAAELGVSQQRASKVLAKAGINN